MTRGAGRVLRRSDMSKVKKNITVQAPVDVVYAAWHNFENFPNFMSNIEEVRVVGNGRSHWKAKGPLGTDVEWDAEVTLDEQNEAIGWRSIEGNRTVKTAGRVNFRPKQDATEVEVTIEYEAPGGVAGEAVAKIFANPERQVEEDLAQFKEIIEQSAELGMRRDSAGGSRYGGSMGGMTEGDVEAVADTNDGVTPSGVDDPALR
jgi:uncharacterized membrane protein